MAIHNLTGNASKEMAILPRTSDIRSNMTDSQKLCAICQKEYRPRFPREFFCNDCYHRWYKEIRERLPWVKFCISSELRRRRQDSKMGGWIFLGNKWDVDDHDRLVPRDGYNG